MISQPSSSPFRATLWAGLAALAVMLSACSKEEKPAAGATAATPAPAVPADATPVDRVIAQARAAIGPEDKLNAINSLLMTGKIFDDKNQAIGSVVLLFNKPGSQHSELHTANQVLVQGSNGVAGWTLATDKNNNKKFTVLPAPDELQNLYMTMENLYFYRAAARVPGSQVSDEGEAQYRGVTCRKVSFHYPNSITYVRYFDSATGKLRGTVLLPMGSEVVEDGTINANGVIFPAVLNYYNKEGKIAQTVKLDKVSLNPKIDPKVFDMPTGALIAAVTTKSAATTKPAASTASAKGSALPNQTKPSGATSGFPSPESLLKK